MMQKNAMIYNELKELNSPLAAISNANVFTVPGGYFDALSSDIMQGIHNEYLIEDLAIPDLDIKVPEGYFEGLADTIMSKIKLEEAVSTEDYGLLAGMRQKNVFTVPDGYFDTLPENILRKLVHEPAKIIEMKPRSSFFKYAIAACITGVIGLSLFSIFDKKEGVEQIVFTKADDNIFKKAYEILKNNDIDKEMESLGDDEITGYLQNSGEDINVALVASLSDEKTLPDEDAYFTDEKALDNFLNQQNIPAPGNN